MKTKKTVEEAIEQGLKIGDEVWVKGYVRKIDKDAAPLCLGLEKENRFWLNEDNEIYLPTDTAPEAAPKLEVGQYWHHPENGNEWLVGEKTQGTYFVCECTKEGGIWAFSEIESWDLDEFNHSGYVLGRHPDNIEAAKPEQWQPKEGELLWHKFFKFKVIFLYMANALGDTKCPIVQDCDSDKHVCVMSELEPYDNQDTKIDFSVAGQWVRNDSNVVLITTGETDELIFYGFNPRNGAECKFRSDLFNWQLLTPEQMKPILELIANI